jgi:hypothetical protein
LIEGGYLVVLRNAGPTVSPRNPVYRGLYRVPPFFQERFAEGFDDPYLVDPDVTPEGLLPSRAVADRFIERFSEDYRPGELEVIAVRPIEVGDGTDGEGEALRLGFDVAALSPFWSILADISVDPNTDKRLAEFLLALNENGLFPEPDLARTYREYYTTVSTDAAAVNLYIWDVREVSPEERAAER